MGYSNIGKSRVTPKFRDAPNFNKVLEFLTEPLDDLTSDILIIKDMKNMDSTSTFVVNGNGSFSVIVKKDLTSTEKSLIEVFSEYFNILCVEKTLLGTVPVGASAFQYGVNGYGTSQYIKKW